MRTVMVALLGVVVGAGIVGHLTVTSEGTFASVGATVSWTVMT